MKVQDWIFSIRYAPPGEQRLGLRDRYAVVGPARASTVEAALHLGNVPETVRAKIRGCDVVRDFVEGRLDPDRNGYYRHSQGEEEAWAVGIGPVHGVLSR